MATVKHWPNARFDHSLALRARIAVRLASKQ